MIRGSTPRTFIRVSYMAGIRKRNQRTELNAKESSAESPTHFLIMVKTFPARVKKSDPRPSTRQSRNQVLSELWQALGLRLITDGLYSSYKAAIKQPLAVVVSGEPAFRTSETSSGKSSCLSTLTNLSRKP
jgi:hypothetical protein